MHRWPLVKPWLIVSLMGLVLVFGTPAAAQIDFKQLLPFVEIQPPAGWEVAQPPSGATTKVPVKMTDVSVRFRAGGNKSLEVAILDCLGDSLPIKKHTQPLELKSGEGYSKPVQILGFNGLETYKTDKGGEINLNIGDRFLVTLKGEGLENTDILKSVAQKLDLKKLAALPSQVR
ncbi:MAG: hypothetical protein AB1491_11610 [Thermodesulfobacteriota bacterium]